jgi:hypothetical protein
MAQLDFTSYDIRESGAFAPKPSDRFGQCGIYVLHFANGDRYVGQSVAVASRVGEHRRLWDDIVRVDFAGCSADDLDQLEVEMIVEQQRQASLRNSLLTSRPGGLRDLDVTLTSGCQIALPWRRSDRLTVRHQPRTFAEPLGTARSDRERAKYAELCNTPGSAIAYRLLGHYLNDTIPAPIETAGERWTITALPSTNKTKYQRRLFTFNVGNVETLWAFAFGDGSEVPDEYRVNVWAEDLLGNPSLATLKSAGLVETETDTTYADGAHIMRITTYAPGLAALLNLPTFLEAAYRLNVHMMRKGTRSSYARFHNRPLAERLLATANDIAIAERVLKPT